MIAIIIIMIMIAIMSYLSDVLMSLWNNSKTVQQQITFLNNTQTCRYLKKTFEHPLLAKVVRNGLVVFYDTRSESSGRFYYPIPAGDFINKTMS